MISECNHTNEFFFSSSPNLVHVIVVWIMEYAFEISMKQLRYGTSQGIHYKQELIQS